MPPPMTLETTMAAASRGPSRRSSEGGGSGITRAVPASWRDELTRDGGLGDGRPLRRPVLGEQAHLDVHELRVLEHLLPRFGAGIPELRLDGQRRCRVAAGKAP